MRETDLPSPSIGSRGFHLRRVAAQAISQLEVSGPGYANGAHPDGAALAAFFTAAAAAAAVTGKNDPVLTLTTAGNATSVAVSATLATTLGKGGSTGAATYATSDPAIATVNGSGVITGVAAGTVTITANVAEATSYKPDSISITITVTP